MFFISTTLVIADSRQIIEYQYDESGNMIFVLPEESSSPPVASNTTPYPIALSGSESILISGVGLRNSIVFTSTDGININVLSSTNDTLKLHISLDSNVSVGIHPLTISTSLGSTTVNIAVLPSLSVYPKIISLSPDLSQKLALNLNALNSSDVNLSLQIADTTKASITLENITIQAGQTHYTGDIFIEGHILGQTYLTVSSPSIIDYTLPILITEPYSLQAGEHSSYSQPLGIVYENSISSNLLLNGPFITQITVQKGNIEEPVVDTNQITYLTHIGVVKGSYISGVSPEALLAGNETSIVTITGVGLSQVDEVRIYPEEGFTISEISISDNEISFPVSISPLQSIGTYQIQLFSLGERIHSGSIKADIFYVANGLPSLNYVDPIVINRDTSVSIDIAGSNFDFVKAIRITVK